MPSRKKAKGKARKAAKEAKAAAVAARAEEKESQAVVNVAVNQRQVREKMLLRRLVINSVSPQNCRHGLVHLSSGEEKFCLEFINAYLAIFVPFIARGDMMEAFTTAHHATWDEYPSMYSSKLDIVVSMLLSRGTQCILDGDNLSPQLYASIACYFDEWMAVDVHKTKATRCWTKIVELESADDHTLVQYFRKRIPCSCLDAKYNEVKSVTKMGRCCNPNCSQGRRVERSKMFSCTRCGAANYCSVECQRADWKVHSSEECYKVARAKAAFRSNSKKS